MYMHIGKLEKTKMYIWSKEFKTRGGLIQQFHFKLEKMKIANLNSNLYVCMYMLLYSSTLFYILNWYSSFNIMNNKMNF